MKAESISIIANGEPREIALPCTVGEFLGRLGWKPSQVVVEYNGQVLRKETVRTTPLKGGDQLEIIVPVAGG